MSIFQNAKIRTKVLCVIIPICLIGIAGALLVSSQYRDTVANYSRFISTDEAASIQMSMANQRLAALSYNAYQIRLYNSKDSEMAGFLKSYEENKQALLERFANVQKLVPEQGAAVEELSVKANNIVAVTDRAVMAGKNDDNDAATKLLKQADGLIGDEALAIRQWVVAFNENIGTKSELLNKHATSTITNTLIALGILFIAAILIAALISARGIAAPIERLRARMASLADGNTQEQIAGIGRRDEVGQMAEAVAVFRDNAVERIRLEQEAADGRSLSERERLEREAQKAKDTADIQFAVDGLA
ncbi:HAMP domain-containing protein, partial [Rhizobium jaguaris]|uniref:HAMP domain-containing protein n=1 Tax=Rhizobium jaguaris TaxID=1312183 RepID=UPI0039BF1EE4